ncbi:MAG: HTH domain-containing protein [Draconibacterium sp.]|nr:HTH domain-containing protein [Draconibacterium sp.]
MIDALSYIKTNIIKGRVKKYADRAEADRIFNYPYEAIEEALANAVYHRNYELREPIEVRVLPESIEIISYNGIDPSLKQADFEKGVVRIRRYRNRRIGSFLKELELTEGRGTGIPTIIRTLKNNGSPVPVFDTDEPNRTYFVIEIPVHPDFVKIDTVPEGRKERLVERLVEGLAESQKKIVQLMVNKPSITIKEMSESIGISTTAIDKNITALKQKGIVDRVGSDSSGKWQINFPQE